MTLLPAGGPDLEELLIGAKIYLLAGVTYPAYADHTLGM
jgi:hypothetical protein